MRVLLIKTTSTTQSKQQFPKHTLHTSNTFSKPRPSSWKKRHTTDALANIPPGLFNTTLPSSKPPRISAKPGSWSRKSSRVHRGAPGVLSKKYQPWRNEMIFWVHPPKFNSSPLKNGGWKTILSNWVPVTFQGLDLLVDCRLTWFQEAFLIFSRFHFRFMRKKHAPLPKPAPSLSSEPFWFTVVVCFCCSYKVGPYHL